MGCEIGAREQATTAAGSEHGIGRVVLQELEAGSALAADNGIMIIRWNGVGTVRDGFVRLRFRQLARFSEDHVGAVATGGLDF